MSDWYYDSKGIKHVTKDGAEAANYGYLSEERRAREESLELQRKQIDSAHQMAVDAQSQRMAQVEHNLRVEQRLAAEAQANEKKRRFEQQVMFLRDSDEQSKAEKMLEIFGWEIDGKFTAELLDVGMPPEVKVGGRIFSNLVDTILVVPNLENEKAALTSVKNQINGKQKFDEKDMSVRAVWRDLKCSPGMSWGGAVGASFGLCLLLTIAFACIIGPLESNGIVEDGSQLQDILSIISFASLVIAFVLPFWLNFRARKSARAALPKLETKIQSATNKLTANSSKISTLWAEAQSLLFTKNVLEHVQRFFVSGAGNREIYFYEFRLGITESQKVFPTNCRIDANSIGLTDLADRHERFVNSSLAAVASGVSGFASYVHYFMENSPLKISTDFTSKEGGDLKAQLKDAISEAKENEVRIMALMEGVKNFKRLGPFEILDQISGIVPAGCDFDLDTAKACYKQRSSASK
jgi:hypothetical protein